jgi:hypothetical protein
MAATISPAYISSFAHLPKRSRRRNSVLAPQPMSAGATLSSTTPTAPPTMAERRGERGRFGHGFDRGERGGRRGGRQSEEEKWVLVTKLSRLVKENMIHSIEEIYLHSLPVKEHQIMDQLVPGLKDEVMKITPCRSRPAPASARASRPSSSLATTTATSGSESSAPRRWPWPSAAPSSSPRSTPLRRCCRLRSAVVAYSLLRRGATRRKDVHRGRIQEEEREHGWKGAPTRSPYYPRSNVRIAGDATVALSPAKSVCAVGSGNTWRQPITSRICLIHVQHYCSMLQRLPQDLP